MPRFDYDTPIEETVSWQYHVVSQADEQMQALHDIVQAGWVRYVGMSR
jgi:aryl-alcohol dehydrogenase-like predicted oxidoreductase